MNKEFNDCLEDKTELSEIHGNIQTLRIINLLLQTKDVH